MEENKNLPALRSFAVERITKQQIVALFNTETIRWNYHKMLQGLKGMVITKDTLKTEYPELKEADKFIKSITEWRKEQAKPFNEVDAMFLEVSKEILQPISEALLSAKAQVRTASEANAAEIAQARMEEERNNRIVKSMADFINKITADITLSTTDKEIASIQMRIGSEKSRKTFYDTYWQELVDKCDSLSSTINHQKDKIREITRLNDSFNKAMENNDDTKAAEIKEQLEFTNVELAENAIRLQEKAFDESMSMSQVEVGIPDLNISKAKTSRWRWKVDDINILRKKSPQFTKIVTDDEAIEAFMKEQRELGLFKTDSTELNISGITFFKEKYW